MGSAGQNRGDMRKNGDMYLLRITVFVGGLDMVRRILVLATLAVLTACQTTVTGEPFVDDPQHLIHQTLDRGTIWASSKLAVNHKLHYINVAEDIKRGIPASVARFNFITKRLGTKKVPVIVYSHGCSGMSQDDHVALEPLLEKSDLEFMVIGANSFGRPRPKSCDGGNRSVRSFHERSQHFRLAELENAIEQVSKQPWAGKIFLMGHSQGGTITAHYQGKHKVAGRIIHAGACGAYGRWGYGNGIQRHEKIIVFHSNSDPWRWIGANSKCPEIGRKHNGVVIVATQPSHNLIPFPEHYNRLISWMKEHF